MSRSRKLSRIVLTTAVMTLAACSMVGTTWPEPQANAYSAVSVQVQGSSLQTVQAAKVAPEFFSQTRVQPTVGRLFIADDYGSAREVTLLGYDLWQKAFGGAPQLIGTAVQIDGRPVTVVGILPQGFAWPKDTQVWMPR